MISAKEIISNYKVVIFDFDDTLVPEREFLYFAYKQIAKYLSDIAKLSEDEVSVFLRDEFELRGREALFDRLLQKYNLPQTLILDFLRIMRTTPIVPGLSLFPDMKLLINMLVKSEIKIFVLTNGNYLQQINKIRHTEWGGLEKLISFIFADLHEPKPSPVCIRLIQKQTGTVESDILFVGDSEVDEQCAINANVDFRYFLPHLQH